MAGNRIQYEVGFTADTSQLKKSVQEAVSALNKVGTSSNSGLTNELKQASQSALELASNLKNATNVDTGKLNLAQFSKSLASSKKTLTDYRVELSKLGPEGQQAFLKMALAVGQAELPMARAGKLLDSMYTTMKNTVKWQISSSALNAFTGALSTAYNYSKDLNKSLNDIRIVSGQSVDQMKDFAREATAAAKELSTTTTAYTEGSLIYFQQGLSTEEVKERTDITIKMANAVGESTEKISDQLTAVWNNFADGTQTLEHYADAMVKLGAYTASSTDEIAQGTEKFASVAKMIGLDFDNAAAALATVTAQTRQSAEVVGTAFKTIFARMESLKLGETLEDGTSLNQYSQALAKVGVNIKDQNGQLKDMTVLIDEIGNRWQQLSRDQQVALAQTVAGVRQYTQFAALFENFDYYQELVGVAKNSEGELSKQAQIYEESWKAAAKRVKASAEEVYNAIINDQMFIDLDNSLTDILHVIAQIVEAAGGLKGLINIATFAALSLYGDKIAEGMRNAAGQAKILLGLETTRVRTTQQAAMEQAKLLPIYTGLSESEFASIEVMNKKIEVQNEINKVIDGYTAAQKEQVRQDQEHLNLLGEVYKAQTKNLEQLNDELAIQQNNKVKAVAGRDMGITDEKKLVSVRATYQNAKNYLSKAGVNFAGIESKDILSQDGKGTKSAKEVSKVARGFQDIAKQVAMAKGNVIQFRKTYEQLNDEQKKSPQLVKELLKSYKLLGNNVKDNELNNFIEKLNVEADGAEAQIRVLGNALTDMGVDNTGLNQIVEIIYKIQNGTLGADKALKRLLDLHSEMKDKLQNSGYEPAKDWASAFTNVAQEISGVMMALRSWKSVLDVWSDDATSLGDKIFQSLTAVAMMAPVLIQNYTKVKNKFEEVFGTKDKIKKYTEELDKLKEAKEQLIPGEEAYVAIEKQEVIVNWELTKARAAANAIALAAVAAILLLTAAYQAYQKHLEQVKKDLEEAAEKSKEAADNAKQEAEANRNLLSSMKEALKTYQENGSNKEELNNLTKQLAQAYNIEGAALAQLTGNYEDYNAVLKKAEEKTKKENQELATKNLEHVSDIENQLINKGHDLKGNEVVGRSLLESRDDGKFKIKIYDNRRLKYSGFDANGNDDDRARQLLKKAGLVEKSSQFLSEHEVVLINKYTNSIDDILNAYDKLVAATDYLEKNMSAAQLENNGIYQSMKADRDTLAENVEEYRLYSIEAKKYLLQVSQPFQNVNNIQEFSVKINEITKQLQESGVALEQIDGVIQAIVENSLDDVTEKLYLQYKVIQDIKKEYENVFGKSDSFIQSIIDEIQLSEGQELDYTILGRINWNLVDIGDSDSINEAYQLGSFQQTSKQSLQAFQDFANGITTIQSNLSDNMTEAQYQAVANAIDWGKDNLIKLNEFLNMSSEQQAGYLNQIYAASYEAYIDQSRLYVETLQEQYDNAQKFYSQNFQEMQKKGIEEYRITNMNLMKDIIENINKANDAEAKAKLVEQYQDQFNNAWKSVFNTDFTDDLAETAEKGFQEVEERFNKSNIGKKGTGLDFEAQASIVLKKNEADSVMKDLQEQMDKTNKEIEVKTRLLVDLKVQNYENYFSSFETLFEQLSNGVKKAFDENGQTIWKFTDEARKAFRTLYPDYAAQLKYMNDGTWAATNEMYQSWFNMNNGILKHDIETKKVQLNSEKQNLQRKIETIDIAIDALQAEGDAALLNQTNINNAVDDSLTLQTETDKMKLESIVGVNESGQESTDDALQGINDGSEQVATNFSTYFKNATDNVCQYFNTAKSAAANMWQTIQTGEMTPDITNSGPSVAIGKDTTPFQPTENTKDYVKDYLNSQEKFDYYAWQQQFSSDDERKAANQELVNRLENTKNNYQRELDAIESAYASIDSILNDYNNKVNNGGSGGSSKVSKPNEVQKAKEVKFKTDEIEELFTTFDKLDREIEKINKSIEKVNREIENNIGYKKEEAIQRKRALLQQNTQKQKEKQQRIIQELTDAGFDIGEIDSETGQFSNYEQIMANLREQKVNNQSTYNATASRFDEQWKALDQERENIQKESDDLWNEFEEGKINQKTYEEKKKAIEQKKESYNVKKQTFESESQTALKIAESLYDSDEKRLDNLQNLVEDHQDKYIETVETIDNNKIEERNLLTDAFVEQFDEIQQRADDIHNFNEFINTYFTQFDDVLNYGTHMIEKYSSNAKASLSAFSGYQEQYYKILSDSDLTDSKKKELIRQLVENMRNEITDIFDQISSMADTLLEMYDKVQERFDKITEDIQRRNSRLSSYQDILALQGYDSVRSKEGRAFYDQAANTRLTNLQNEYGVEQSRLTYWESQRETALAELSKLNDSNDPQKLLRAQIQKSLEEIENNYQQSQDRMIEITQESLELIKEMYNNTLDQQLYDYEKELTGGLGFDQLQTNIDYNFEAEERYLDMVNEEYAVKEFGRKLDKAINDSQNKYAAEQYENLRDEMEQRRKNGKLSQYDLDLMNSKLEVTKAQMALEEAQNAKSTVRLVRNGAGNWDYQFTADQNKIDEAQSKYDKAVNDSYNLAKNYYKTNMQNIIALRKETYSQIEQIVKDETLTETQKEEAIKKVREQALDKYQYIMSEMKIAQKDMSEFGKATTEDYHNVFKGVTEGLDLSYKSFEESFDKNTNKMKQTFSYFGQLLNSTAHTMSSDLNSVKKEMQDLTTATNDWKNATSDAISEINSHKGELNDFISLVKDLNKALEGSKKAVGAVGFTTGVADNKTLGEQYRQTTDEKTKEFLRDRMKDNLQKQNITLSDKEIEQAISDYTNDVDLLQMAIDLFHNSSAGNFEIEDVLKRRNNKINLWGLNEKKISTIEQLRKYIKNNGLATGGYTGDFSGARLAFLHEKELILNKTDTQNILSAVAAVRELAPALLEKIGQSLNGQILAGRSLMESRMNIYKPNFSTETQPLEQNVIIQADFPGVSAAVEIEAALNNLINDATQYASVVRG